MRCSAMQHDAHEMLCNECAMLSDATLWLNGKQFPVHTLLQCSVVLQACWQKSGTFGYRVLQLLAQLHTSKVGLPFET